MSNDLALPGFPFSSYILSSCVMECKKPRPPCNLSLLPCVVIPFTSDECVLNPPTLGLGFCGEMGLACTSELCPPCRRGTLNPGPGWKASEASASSGYSVTLLSLAALSPSVVNIELSAWFPSTLWSLRWLIWLLLASSAR